MTDEIKNNDDSTTTENATGTEQDKTEKVFKQADVDRIIKERLEREKVSSKKIKEDADLMVKDYEAKLETYEDVLKSFVEKEKNTIPENFRGLLAKLSLIEQYQFLTDPKNLVEKQKIPETPKGVKQDSENTKKLTSFL